MRADDLQQLAGLGVVSIMALVSVVLLLGREGQSTDCEDGIVVGIRPACFPTKL